MCPSLRQLGHKVKICLFSSTFPSLLPSRLMSYCINCQDAPQFGPQPLPMLRSLLRPPDPNLVLVFLLQAKGSQLLSSTQAPARNSHCLLPFSPWVVTWVASSRVPRDLVVTKRPPVVHALIVRSVVSLMNYPFVLFVTKCFLSFSSFPDSSLHTPFPFLPTVNK